MSHQSKGRLYHRYPNGYSTQSFKATCTDCGKVLGMFSVVNNGVSHIIADAFTCLECLRRAYGADMVTDSIPGAKEFVRSLLEGG